MCGIVGIFDCIGKRAIAPAILERMNESQHHRTTNPASAWAIAGSPSSTCPPASSRCTTKTAASASCSTARSTTTRNSSPNCRPWATSSTPAATPKSSCTPGRPGAKLREALPRHVRLRPLGPQPRDLFLARDRLGVKPLYYALLPDGSFLFGSELKSLLAHGGLKREIDPCAVEEYFALGYVAEPRAIFKQANKLPPAARCCCARPAGRPAA
jgi:asparagine synthase (glutamine-hydrolysing)